MVPRWIRFFCIANCAVVILSADPKCSKGIIHPNSDIPVCCSASCGDTCGAKNCADIDGAACCGNRITASGKSCNSNDPPCIISGVTTPAGTCAKGTGILAVDGSSCCALSCGSCGGTDCSKRPGGDSNCCTGAIKEANKACGTPPCVEGGTATNKTCSQAGGIVGADGVSCCAAQCGTCGGSGCEQRPGGVTMCCTSSIKSANKSCNTNAAPCVLQTGSTPPTIPGTSKRKVSLGIYTSSPTPKQREAAFGIGKIFDYRLIFQNVFDLDYSEITEVLNDGYIPLLNLEFGGDGPGPVLSKIVSGVYDGKLKAFASACAKGGKEFWIRTLHEHNGNWYPWGLLYRYNGVMSNTLTDLKASFKRVIGIFNAAGAPVKFQLNINSNNGLDDPRPLSAFWPGTEGMSAVSITSYNRAYSTPNHQYTQSFYTGFKKAYDEVSKLTTLPIWVAETGTTSYGTNKPLWIRETFKSIAVDFPRVVQVTWFLTNKVNEGKLTDWDLNTDEDKKAFKDGFLELKRLTS